LKNLICQEVANTFCQMKTGGQLIRERREAKGLLLRHIAAFLDIDQAILSRIERSERKPTRENIIKLAEVLSISENELLIQFMSDKIAFDIVNEDCASQALKVAGRKVKYLKEHLNK